MLAPFYTRLYRVTLQLDTRWVLSFSQGKRAPQGKLDTRWVLSFSQGQKASSPEKLDTRRVLSFSEGKREHRRRN